MSGKVFIIKIYGIVALQWLQCAPKSPLENPYLLLCFFDSEPLKRWPKATLNIKLHASPKSIIVLRWDASRAREIQWQNKSHILLPFSSQVSQSVYFFLKSWIFVYFFTLWLCFWSIFLLIYPNFLIKVT